MSGSGWQASAPRASRPRIVARLQPCALLFWNGRPCATIAGCLGPLKLVTWVEQTAMGAALGEIQNFPRGGRRWPWRRRRRPSGRGLAPLLGLAVLGVGALLYAMPTAEEAGRIDRLLASAGDRDCRDFATRWEAQSFFRRAGPGDPHRLDDDGDGLACEFNAWFDLSGWFGR